MANNNDRSNKSYRGYENNINIVGLYPKDKMQKALSCNGSINTWTEFLLSEIVELPVLSPNIEEIVEIHSYVEIISQKVVKTPTVIGYTSSNGTHLIGSQVSNGECSHLTGRKLVLEGLLNQKIIYTALVDNQSIHTINYKTPFSTFIIIDSNTHLNQPFNVESYIESSNAYNLSIRNIHKTTSIFISVTKSC